MHETVRAVANKKNQAKRNDAVITEKMAERSSTKKEISTVKPRK